MSIHEGIGGPRKRGRRPAEGPSDVVVNVKS